MSAKPKDKEAGSSENSAGSVTTGEHGENVLRLSKVRRIRGGHRAFVKRTIQTSDNSISEFTNSARDIEILEAFKITLKDKKSVLQNYDEKILEFIESEEEIMQDISDSSEFCELINRTIYRIETCLKVNSPKNVGLPTEENYVNLSAPDINNRPNKAKLTAKLPKLTLTSYNGDPKIWQSFWDSFHAAVNSNDSISKVDKFNYLKGLLEGAASSCIAGLSLTEQNYDSAVDLLHERFGNKQVMISSYMDTLIDLSPVSNANDIKRIRSLFDSIEVSIRSLDSLGVDSNSYGSILVPIILKKIPEELRLIISRKCDKDRWSIDELLVLLKEELEARERINLMNPGSSSSPSSSKQNYSNYSRKPDFRYKPQPTTASTMHSSANKDTFNSNSKVIYCVFCGQKHPSAECTVVADKSARKGILRQKAKCFICLRSGHVMRDCKVDYTCYSCGARHNKAICDSSDRQHKTNSQSKSESRNDSPKPTTNSSSTMCVNSSTSVLLQTAVAYVSNPTESSQSLMSHILFDNCSQRTYITEKSRNKLRLSSIGQETLLIKTFGDDTPRLRTCDVVQFSITCLDGMQIYVKAFCVPSICSPVSDQCIQVAVNKYPHLQNIQLANPSNIKDFDVDILIGADYYWNFFNGGVRRGEYNGPVALMSRLGWIVSGPVVDHSLSRESSVNLVSTHVLHINSVQESCQDIPLKEEVHKFWDLETIGIRENESSVYADFIEEVKFIESNQKYEVKLPFKECHPILPDGYSESYRRLGSLLRRLKSKPEILKEYNRIIEEQMSEDIIEMVEPLEISNPGQIHYLPHREVLRLDKETTKLRLVYDASAKKNGPSLNDCLYAGPSLNPLIFDILIRFRMNSIAVIGDIQKAFLNISIAPEHRDYLRFLWVDNPFCEYPIIQTMRFKRVVFGVTSSPFILNATIRHHLYSKYPGDSNFVNSLLKSLYVDDFASGSHDVQSTFDLCRKVRESLLDGGFNMRKWMSNSSELMSLIENSDIFTKCQSNNIPVPSITEEDRGYSMFLQDTSFDCSSVLGQKWDCQLDMFQFQFDKVLSSLDPNVVLSKRVILSTTAKFYDPVGLIAPIVVLFKIGFQSMCKKGLDWDDPIDDKFCDYWNELLNSLSEVDQVSFPRCVCDNLTEAEVQLHVFSDSSEKAYGSCVYLRCKHPSGVIHSNLIASKTRVVPLSKTTIPRLELLGCLISARLAKSVVECLNDMFDITSVYFWSDSSVALSWIKNVHKEFKQFVQNRVIEIRKLTSVDNWFYCNTKENPADICSRGIKARDLVDNYTWWHGPPFLVEPKGLDFHFNVTIPDNFEIASEIKTTSCLAGVNIRHNIGQLISVSKYSSIDKLLRITAYVLRFVRNIKAHIDNIEVKEGDLTNKELRTAECIWLRYIQQQIPDDVKFKQRKLSLNLIEDSDNILRCNGRIQNSSLSYDTKFPVFLPENHDFTKLVIEKCHKDVFHNGVQETLTQLRCKYWICRGRQIVRQIIQRCTLCRKLEGKSYGVPRDPPLPGFRLSDDFAFSNIGVDYAGPLYVKDIYSKSEDMNKVFIALYTCASSRAIHLDLVPDASSTCFIRSFQRFIGRRGIPSFVISDNGKNFKSDELRAFTNSKNIKWSYNVERSPWWGGFFERMVRSVKRCLKKILGTARLTYEELLTVLIQIEGVVNSRPLTYVSEESVDPLTPSHLVIGRRLLSEPNSIVHTASDPIKRKKYLTQVLDHFWSRWRKEYLTELREHHRNHSKKGPLINEDDVVLVYEDKIPRMNWSMARVVRTLVGRDNNVRSAVIRVPNKLGKMIEMNRPIQKLFPVELAKDSN